MRVEAAGIGQHPHPRAADQVVLWPDRGARQRERGAVGGHPDDGQPPRPQPGHLGSQQLAASHKLGSAELVSAGGRASHDIRNAQTVSEQLLLLAGS